MLILIIAPKDTNAIERICVILVVVKNVDTVTIVMMFAPILLMELVLD